MIRFASPLYLILFIPAILFVWLYLRKIIGKEAVLRFSSVALVREAGARSSSGNRLLKGILYFLLMAFMILALARPQTATGEDKTTKNAVDIMISLDISGSMATLDFHPDNRLTAAKIEARRFIEGRKNDRIGLVVFGGQSFTQCPLTIDHDAILSLLDKIQLGMVMDGTAIGLGLANAVNRLKDSEAKSKVIILLTDGVNNAGEIDPVTAANLARQFKVKVYTIGVGKEGVALLPIQDPRFGLLMRRVETQIDEATLEKISKLTGGAYFRAQDEQALRRIFKEIDSLEKTEIQVEKITHYDEHFVKFLWPALLVLCILVVWSNVIVVKIP